MPISWLKDASGGRISNKETITFPSSTADWFTGANKASHYVIFDGSGSSANVLGAGAFYAPMEIGENQTIIIAAGLLSISLEALILS